MATKANNYTSRIEYYYDENSGTYIPVSTRTLASDVIFTDNTTLSDKIAELKKYGADVKTKVASAVSYIQNDFTETDATWSTLRNLAKAMNGRTITQEFGYTGNIVTYTAPVTGLYKIDCYGASGGSHSESFNAGSGSTGVAVMIGVAGGLGYHVSGLISLTKGQILYITVGGQNGYNGGGDDASDTRTATLNYYTCKHKSSSNKTSVNTYSDFYIASTIATCGGGATDIRLGGTGLSNRILVAGGGAGSLFINPANVTNSSFSLSIGNQYHRIVQGSSTATSNKTLGNGSNASATAPTITQNTATTTCSSSSCSRTYSAGGAVFGNGSGYGGGGGGYYGGQQGQAGTSYISSKFSNATKEVRTIVSTGLETDYDGKAIISLVYS